MRSLYAFVAQNMDAGENKRATGIFTNDGQVIEAAAQYLKSYAIDTLLVPFLFCSMGFFNGCEKTKNREHDSRFF